MTGNLCRINWIFTVAHYSTITCNSDFNISISDIYPYNYNIYSQLLLLLYLYDSCSPLYTHKEYNIHEVHGICDHPNKYIFHIFINTIP